MLTEKNKLKKKTNMILFLLKNKIYIMKRKQNIYNMYHGENNH